LIPKATRFASLESSCFDFAFAGVGVPCFLALKILETERLILRELCAADAQFILQLVNEPAWLRFIGDKNIKTPEAAETYIRNGPVKMYASLGFGLWLVELKDGAVPIGICGLIKRKTLDDIDLGFAFLRAYWRKGYAFESASATMAHGWEAFGLRRMVAIASPENLASHCLLEKLGFRFERMIQLSPDAQEIRLYATISIA
jgi:RimJ/RimL family protein N-acetyltransferase